MIEAQSRKLLRNSEDQPKFTLSYKKTKCMVSHFVKVGLSLSDAALCHWVPHEHSDNGTNQFLDQKLTKLEQFKENLSIFLKKISQIQNINFSKVFELL